jgi:hypothetical protein
MTTLTVTLSLNKLVPRMTSGFPKVFLFFGLLSTPAPLAILIVGRDVVLGCMALYHRYRSLPVPVSTESSALSNDV